MNNEVFSTGLDFGLVVLPWNSLALHTIFVVYCSNSTQIINYYNKIIG